MLIHLVRLAFTVFITTLSFCPGLLHPFNSPDHASPEWHSVLTEHHLRSAAETAEQIVRGGKINDRLLSGTDGRRNSSPRPLVPRLPKAVRERSQCCSHFLQ